jgi:FixJ family two-component response regulator
LPDKRILIVDDALDLGRLLKNALLTISSDFDITVVPSAEEAQLEASRSPLDLVISDIRLPGISGFDLVKRLQQKYENVKFMLITGMDDVDLEVEAESLGVSSFLRKPMSMSDFIQSAMICLELETNQAQISGIRAKTKISDTRGKKELLMALKEEIHAQYAGILNPYGQISFGIGQFPADHFEAQWLSIIQMLVVDQKRLFALFPNGEEKLAIMTFQNKNFHLYIAFVEEIVMLLTVAASQESIRQSLIFDSISKAQKRFLKLREQKIQTKELLMPTQDRTMDMASATSALDRQRQVEADLEPDSEDFGNLFEDVKKEDLKVDAESFWNNTEAKPFSQNGFISYEEARNLGIALKDEINQGE